MCKRAQSHSLKCSLVVVTKGYWSGLCNIHCILYFERNAFTIPYTFNCRCFCKKEQSCLEGFLKSLPHWYPQATSFTRTVSPMNRAYTRLASSSATGLVRLAKPRLTLNTIPRGRKEGGRISQQKNEGGRSKLSYTICCVKTSTKA